MTAASDGSYSGPFDGLLLVLESKWADGGRTSGTLQDGLSDEAIDFAVAETGVLLPDDVRSWFRWHNGVMPALNLDVRVGGSGMRFRRLETLVADYHQLVSEARESAEAFGGSDAENGWDPSWFPIFRSLGGVMIGVDCSASHAGYLHASRNLEVTRDVAPSLADVVGWWCELYDLGVYRFDGVWEIDDRLPVANRYPALL